MNEAELFIAEEIKTLVPNYDTIELDVTVYSPDYSLNFSLEFFATVDGKKMQCFDLFYKGMFTEKDFISVSESIARYFAFDFEDDCEDAVYFMEHEYGFDVIIKKYTVHLKDDEVNIKKYNVYMEDTVYLE